MTRRIPKTGRTAGLPAEQPPASLVWNEQRCTTVTQHLFTFLEVTFGSEAARKIWEDAARKPRERSIKALSDADMVFVIKFLAERDRTPGATRNAIARRVAKNIAPADARRLGILTHENDREDYLRAVTQGVSRRVARYEDAQAQHAAARDALDPWSIVANVDELAWRKRQ